MVEDDDPLGYELALEKGSGNRITTNRNDLSKPVIFRGITKRKHIYKAIEMNRDYYYMDTGYFGNFRCAGNPAGKKTYHRVVKNELQLSKILDKPADRWNALVKADNRLKWTGWKTKGHKILLVLPNPKSCHFYGFELDPWLNQTIATIKANTDMPIVTRIKGSRGERNENSIYDELDKDIFATVTFASIAAMESIAYGIPAFVSVPCAAYPLASSDISKITKPFYPDENLIQKHCWSLAYGQFTYNEIIDGTAWRLLNQ